MAKDGLTYSESVRAAAAEAAAALRTDLEAIEQRADPARRQPGNDRKTRVLLDVDAEKDKEAPRKRPDVQRADARTITTLEASIADLRSLLAKAEGRAADERSRCDRLIAETLAANTRAVHLEGELTALRASITTLETCIAELRSLLAKAEERASDERSRCDRLVTEIVAANARAEHLEGELTALRAAQARPWWRRLYGRAQ
jgi:chromosome segregation ATPase